MSRPALSLQDLVRHAAMELRCRFVECYGASGASDWGRASLEDALADLLDAVDQGDFSQILHFPGRFAGFSAGVSLDSFEETCELANRIDCFLEMPLPGIGRALAAACRNDLDALAVLADWLTDNGQPRAADEARYLLGLVQTLPRDPRILSSSKPPDWWVYGMGAEEFFEETME